jgi:thiol:disulfide interchange protein
VWLLLLMLLFGLIVYSQRTPDSEIAWIRHAAAMPPLRDANRPVLLYFTADWCGPCQAMHRKVWHVDRVERAVNETVLPVYLDVDDPNNRRLVERHGVESIPTFILLRRGREIARNSGYLSADQVVALTEAARRAEVR